MKDTFPNEAEEKAEVHKKIRSRVLASGLQFDAKKYEYSDEFVPANIDNPLEIHTTGELVEAMKKHKGITVEARVLGHSSNGRGVVRMDKKAFLECSAKRDSKKLRETMDAFAVDDLGGGSANPLIGHDFTPLLGGPFNKQLYYRDYLRMIATCFYAYHHDPVARDLVSIMTDFTIGRGFQLHTSGKDKDKAQLIWDAFAKVNSFSEQFDYCGLELSIYGETMWWNLPDMNTRITFGTSWPGEVIKKGALPRTRLFDPSNIAEIITIPEDMLKGVIAYVWLAPTQYQMYSDGRQPSAKFIYTQLPASQVKHFKVNCVSNEKRGRSDYFPALGYMKRLRDAINYALVREQKNAAWAIDTSINGNQEDVDNYVSDQKSLGQYAPAGSEFVHTEAIKRTYLSNTGGAQKGGDTAQTWALNMACMAAGIPLSYLGTHLSGASTRANALVSTEPVAKKFERRRNVYDRIIHSIFDDLMRYFQLNADCEIIFPELISQDRSAVIKDLASSEMAGWFSKETCAVRAAKEFDLKDYDFKTEQAKVKTDGPMPMASPASINPLTTPGNAPQTQKSSALTSPEKKQVKDNLRQL